MPAAAPTPAQRALLERHLDELDLWNRRLNLTSVPRELAWDRHVLESLELLEVAALRGDARCADLGSGAGFPGVAIAVLRPDISMTLIEADRRKAGFLVHVAGLLDLDNVSVASRRAEEMSADDEQRGTYDAVVSRAAAPPAVLVELAMPLLREGGRLWALVADAPAAVGAVRRASARAAAVTSGILMVENRPSGGR